jgi:outer membrane protein assembly factor BamB
MIAAFFMHLMHPQALSFGQSNCQTVPLHRHPWCVGILDGGMYCLDRTNGITIWSKTFAGGRFQSSPTVLKYSGKTVHPEVTGIVQ